MYAQNYGIIYAFLVVCESMLAIIEWQLISDTQTQTENSVNTWQYRNTVAEVRSIWCTKKDARALFCVDAKGDKMTVRIKSILG